MRLLTPTGYRDIEDCQVGDEVSAFDMETGAPLVNVIESIAWVDHAEWVRWHTNADLPPFRFYRINDTWALNSEQSIWRNGTNVCHAKHLVVGDTLYDDEDEPVTITSIEEVELGGWWRFDISGDHSYIIDGLTLHNASRFWVSGTGTWDSSSTTHWGSSSGVANNASVPGSADTVTFDGSSGGGTATLNFGGTIIIQSFAGGAFTGTFENSVNNNNMTLSSSSGMNISGSGTRTYKLGSATYSLTSSSIGATLWNCATTTGLTLTQGTSVIDFTGAVGAGTNQTFSGGGKTYGTLKISGARLNSGLNIIGANTFSILNIAAAATVSLASANTITTLTTSAQFSLVLPSNTTTTITNAPTLTGSLSAPNAILNNAATSLNATISITSGAMTGTYTAIEGITFSGGATFTFTNSFNLGLNSGATITAPSASSGGGIRIAGHGGLAA